MQSLSLFLFIQKWNVYLLKFRLIRACDEGKSYVEDFPDSIATKKFLEVFKSMYSIRRLVILRLITFFFS